MVNVGKYTIHGWYGYIYFKVILSLDISLRICDPWCFFLGGGREKNDIASGKLFRGPQPPWKFTTRTPLPASHPGDKAIRPTATFEDLRSGK